MYGLTSPTNIFHLASRGLVITLLLPRFEKLSALYLKKTKQMKNMEEARDMVC